MSKLKLALVADKLTSDSLKGSCQRQLIVPYLYGLQLTLYRQDILFVESAWHGWHDSWKYKIASYPGYPKRNNRALFQLLEIAHKRHIPTVFWDKEGLVHFDRFIDSARHFEHVFTVDADTVSKYKAVMGQNASVHVLPFAVQPAFHFFDGFHFKNNTSTFVGSYSTHIHPNRKRWQDMLFGAALKTKLGLHVFDRNSKRRSEIYRYPDLPKLEVHPAVHNQQTASIYKHYLVSLNVNTNEHSSTMVSRRLVEILACGGIAVTTPALSVDAMFKDYCHVVSCSEETEELFSRLKYGPSREDLERARAGADYVVRHHTWNHRLQTITDVIGL